MNEHQIISVSDDPENLVGWLERAESLHRLFRPALPASYREHMRKMFSEGAEMAVLHVQGVSKSLAVFRCHTTTFHGYRFYIDDLVTDESARGSGFGTALLSWCESLARDRNCDSFDLESGVQRQRAHRFYFRQGLTISTFGFTKRLP